MTTSKNMSHLKGQKHMKNNCFASVSVHADLPGKEHDKLLPSVAWKQSSGTLRTFPAVALNTTYIFICRYHPSPLADKGVRGESLRKNWCGNRTYRSITMKPFTNGCQTIPVDLRKAFRRGGLVRNGKTLRQSVRKLKAQTKSYEMTWLSQGT